MEGQLQEAILQWVHFIRPDYYVASALEEEGESSRVFGLSTQSSCFTDRCELPSAETMAERMASDPSGRRQGADGSCTLSTSDAPSMASTSGLVRGEKFPTPP